MATSRLIAEIEVKNGELAIKQVKGFNDEIERSGKAGSRGGKGLEEHEKKVGKLSKASENWLGMSAKLATGLGAVYLAAKGVKDAISFESQEKTAGNLLKNLHEAHSGHLQKMVTASERASEFGGFSKEEEFSGMERALGITHNTTAAIKAHTEAMDLAREKGLGLAKAEVAVNQALVGKTGRLQKLVGIIQPYTKYVTELGTREKENKGWYATDAEKKHAQLLDQIQTREEALGKIEAQSKGSRSAYAHSLKGEWEDLRHTVSNLTEKLGAALIPALKSVVGELMKGVEWVKKNWSWFRYLAVAVLGVAVAIKTALKAQAIYNDVQKAGALVTKAFRWALMEQTEASRLAQVTEDLRAVSMREATGATEGATVASYEFDAANILWIGSLVLGIAIIALVATHFKLFKEAGLDAFHWVEQTAKNVWGWIKSNWPLLLDILLGPFGFVVGWVINHFSAIQHTAETVFGAVKRFVGGIWHDMEKAAEWFVNGVIGGLDDLIKAYNFVQKHIPFGLGAAQVHEVHRVHFAAGGIVPGYGFGDSVPAMLTPGEFVLNRQAVSSLGVGTLNTLNSGFRGRGAEAQEYVPIVVVNKMDSRVLSESTTRYALKKRRGA